MRSILLALLVTLSGCGARHFELSPPGHFLELDEERQLEAGYMLRATSADGVVVSVRQIDNERHGSSDFWVDAIRNQLRRGGGYALSSESEVHARTGEAGHQMRFGRDDEGRPYQYWLTVFVTHDRIFVIEAGGRADRFAEAEAEVEAAIGSFAVR